jgi:small subunit ribosomal protein S21
MQVKVINGDIESAMKRLKRALHDDGLIKEVLQRRFYEKPSEKRRRRHQEAIRNQRKQRRLRESQF